MEFGSRNNPPPPKLKFSQILVLTFQITPPLPNFKTLIFFSESKSDLFQIPPNGNLARSWHFRFWLSRSPPPPPFSGGWSMWRLIAVSPKDAISFPLLRKSWVTDFLWPGHSVTFCTDHPGKIDGLQMSFSTKPFIIALIIVAVRFARSVGVTFSR